MAGPTTDLQIVPSLAAFDRAEWDACANPGWTLTIDGPRRLEDCAAVALPLPGADLLAAPAAAIPLPDAGIAAETGAYNPFVSHDFLWSLEEAGCAVPETGWAGRHLCIRDSNGRIAGIVPCYLKSHSQGEYVFDHGWADAFERAGGRYYPKLQVSVPFTPATGPRLLARGDNAAGTRALLVAGLAALADHSRASSVHATFLTDGDADAFSDAGWLERHDQQFHWHNHNYRDFDDFLEAFASRKRKQVKRERREAVAAGIEIRWLTGRDITEADWDQFFAFYMDTGSRKWGRPYLNRRFYSLLGERMAGAVLLVMAYREGRAIAGALNLIGSDTLYGRYWGAIEEHPFLHFEVCYHQAVEFALKHGLKRVEAGAQGDHKLARGYLPVTTRSAHYIANPGLRSAVARYLLRERSEVQALQDAMAEAAPFKRSADPDDAAS